jgi:hypothetical protein
MPYEPLYLTETQIEIIRALKYVEAVKQVREWTGCGLFEAVRATHPYEPLVPGLMVPTLHPGGTLRRELVDQNIVAWVAVGLAIEAMGNCRLVRRDYDSPGGAAFRTAQRQHSARTERLIEVMLELGQIRNAILAQREESRS